MVTILAAVIAMVVSVGALGVQPAQAETLNAASVEDISSVVASVRANIVSKLSDTNEYKSLAGSEWDVMALARDNTATNKDIFERYYSDITDELVQKGTTEPLGTTPTEYERVILALTAAGYDATNVNGYNFFDYISSYSNVMKQTINAAIFGLLAVKSNSNYKFTTVADSADQTTETKLIDFILDSEKTDGGWALFGSVSDIDVTGMALQALAPYRGTKEDAGSKISDAVDRGVAMLSERQTTETGSYLGGGYLDFFKEENACSQAQVVTALGSLGISFTDARFVKGTHSTVENLLQFYLGDGTFMNKKSMAHADGMAQEQSYYALVAYQRAVSGRNSLYNMNAEAPTTDDSGTHANSSKKHNTASTPHSSRVIAPKENAAAAATAAFESVIFSAVPQNSSVLVNNKNGADSKKKSSNSAKKDAQKKSWDFTAGEYDSDEDPAQAQASAETSAAAATSPFATANVGLVVAIAAAAIVAAGGITGTVLVVKKQSVKAGHSRA
jgi:hypothetical protein